MDWVIFIFKLSYNPGISNIKLCNIFFNVVSINFEHADCNNLPQPLFSAKFASI